MGSFRYPTEKVPLGASLFISLYTTGCYLHSLVHLLPIKIKWHSDTSSPLICIYGLGNVWPSTHCKLWLPRADGHCSYMPPTPTPAILQCADIVSWPSSLKQWLVVLLYERNHGGGRGASGWDIPEGARVLESPGQFQVGRLRPADG